VLPTAHDSQAWALTSLGRDIAAGMLDTRFSLTGAARTSQVIRWWCRTARSRTPTSTSFSLRTGCASSVRLVSSSAKDGRPVQNLDWHNAASGGATGVSPSRVRLTRAHEAVGFVRPTQRRREYSVSCLRPSRRPEQHTTIGMWICRVTGARRPMCGGLIKISSSGFV
jgi:hypothetical protein